MPVMNGGACLMNEETKGNIDIKYKFKCKKCGKLLPYMCPSFCGKCLNILKEKEKDKKNFIDYLYKNRKIIKNIVNVKLMEENKCK